ncbi:MAG TPA: SIS domain-containing protein, partial [Chloroflexia bacterium]|nr:SIS domain-containing protein [Chloroflexia bacterium]
MGLRDEIFEQPAVLQRWLDTQLPAVQEITAAIRQREVDYVFLAARGTSDHAGVYAQYVWGSRNRLPVALAAPSLFTMYAEAPRLAKALVVGISQSGQSPDVVAVIAAGRRQGAVTLAVTNDIGSPLAQAAEFTVDIQAGQEQAVAATKTYSAELLALAALSAALAGSPAADLAALAALPGAV